MDLPPLTDLEHMVLLVVATLGETDAYGVAVRQELSARTGRDVAIGSVYAALERLEDRHYVTGSLGEPTAERGGRAKKFFRVKPEGLAALQAYRDVLTGLWADADGVIGAAK